MFALNDKVNIMFGSTKLRGHVSTRRGVVIPGMKTKYAVDPGLQDTVAPIACAQISALAPRNTSYVTVRHVNNPGLSTLPDTLRYLNTGSGRGLLPGAGYPALMD